MEFSFKLFLLVLLLPIIARCQYESIYQECGKNSSVSSSIGLLQNNLNSVFFSLLANTSTDSYATISVGAGTDAIYGLTRCRGDVSIDTCSSCVLDAVNKIRTICPVSAEARIWYDECFLQYDSNNFLGQLDTSNIQKWFSSRKSTDPLDFDHALGMLLDLVIRDATAEDTRFGWGQGNLSRSNMTIYAMAQCTRDLQDSQCNQCLEKLSEIMSQSCKYHLDCYVISISCVLRYEINSFLIGSAAPSPDAHAPISP